MSANSTITWFNSPIRGSADISGHDTDWPVVRKASGALSEVKECPEQ